MLGSQEMDATNGRISKDHLSPPEAGRSGNAYQKEGIPWITLSPFL